MSDTPRTDGLYAECMGSDPYADTELEAFRDFARDLERELAECITVRDSLAKAADKQEADKEYNAELCEELTIENCRLREALQQAQPFLQEYSSGKPNGRIERIQRAVAAALGGGNDQQP